MLCIDKRYLIALLSCLGFALMELLPTSSQMRTSQWMNINDITHDSSSVTNVIYFIGLMTSLVGGIISTHYGGSVVFGVAMLLCAGINLLSGFLLNINLLLFMAANFFDAAMQGVMYSSIADVWSRWTTLQHRSKYVSFTLAGYQLSEIIRVMFFTEENNPLEFVATCAAIWAIVWLLSVKNDPSQDENLSNTEKVILQERLKFLDEKSVALSQYPWLPILTSKSIWALNGASFITGVSTFIISGILPSLLPHFEGNDNMLILNASSSIFIMIVGCIVDYVRNNNIVTNNEHLKVFVCVTFVAQGVILIAFYLSYMCNYPIVRLLLYLLDLIFAISADISTQTTVIDLSPRFASLLNGIQYSFYALGLLWVYLLENPIKQWLLSHHPLPFIIAVPALYFIGASLYYLFGSTKLQSWNGISNDGQELEHRSIVEE